MRRLRRPLRSIGVSASLRLLSTAFIGLWTPGPVRADLRGSCNQVVGRELSGHPVPLEAVEVVLPNVSEASPGLVRYLISLACEGLHEGLPGLDASGQGLRGLRLRGPCRGGLVETLAEQDEQQDEPNGEQSVAQAA